MRAAILREYGGTPEVGDFEAPDSSGGQVLEVLAAGLNPVDISIASGNFYAGSPPLPYVVGREGVGRTQEGELVYFDSSVAPFGSLAERAAIEPASGIPLPDGLDPALATCFGIAGTAAWLALEWRAQVTEGETVLVLGASGVVGQIAVQAAKLLGAGRVVAAARSAEGLERAQADGADAVVALDDSGDLVQALKDASGEGYDVVIDPLWGEPAAAAIEACRRGGRLVQLGQSAGAESTLTSASVRGKALSILGHSNFVAPPEVRRAAYERMAEHGARGELRAEIERVALDDAPDAWGRQKRSPGRKLVIVP